MEVKNLVALLLIVAVGFAGYFVSDYFNKSSEADSLSVQIQNTNQSVASVSNQTKAAEAELADLTKRANEIQTAIVAENLTMPARFNSNDLVQSILMLGKNSELIVIPLNTQEWTSVKIDKHSYQVFRMTIEVGGLQERLVDFVQQLQGTFYDTLVIESLTITKPLPTPSPVATYADETPVPTPGLIEDDGRVKSKIQLAVYTK
jgi:Tfp pilus assembly protein PilO